MSFKISFYLRNKELIWKNYSNKSVYYFRIVQGSVISKKQDLLAKRKAGSSKRSRDPRKEESKQYELTMKKLQVVSKKVVDQRQTIKMLRQKLRRLETRFDMQKNLIKHLNSKLGEMPKERKIKIELQSE